MMAQPLVSILTPSFNHGTFLEECLQSVQSQTYPNIEHLVQDGNSTDETLSILQNFPSVLWESSDDHGQSDALNTALQRSKGDYIGILNADDAYTPDAIEQAVAILERHPDIAVVYGDQYNVSEEGKILSLYAPDSYSFESLYCVEMVIPAQAAFFRRSSLEQVGFYIERDLESCPDYELWVRLGLHFPMLYVPRVFARYRVHADSETAQRSMVPVMVEARRQVMQRLQNRDEYRPRLQALQDRAEVGLNLWATIALLNCHERRLAFPFLWKAITHPQTISQKAMVRNSIRRWFRP